MRPDAHLSEATARQLEAFADEHGIRIDHAYELLVSVGLEILDDVEMAAYVEDGQLILECDRCGSIFDSAAGFLNHEHDHDHEHDHNHDHDH